MVIITTVDPISGLSPGNPRNYSENWDQFNLSTPTWITGVSNDTMNTTQDNLTIVQSTLSSNLLKASDFLDDYFVPIIVIIGLIGNGFSLAVFSQKDFSQSISSMLFRVLAVVDSLSMLSYDVLHVMADRLFRSVVTWNHVTCRLFVFPYFLLRSYSGWIIALVCLERVIGVVSPHRARVICTHHRFRLLLVVQLLVLAAAYSPLIASTGHFVLQTDTGEAREFCSLAITDDKGLLWFAAEMFLYMNLMLGSLVPFVLILSLNVTIVATIMRQNPLSTSRSGSSSGFGSVSVMLMLVSGAYLVLSIPYPIYFMLDHYSRVTNNISVSTDVLILFGTACNICDTLNHSINIFMYCLSGTKFRTALVSLLTCRNLRDRDKAKPSEVPTVTRMASINSNSTM